MKLPPVTAAAILLTFFANFARSHAQSAGGALTITNAVAGSTTAIFSENTQWLFSAPLGAPIPETNGILSIAKLVTLPPPGVVSFNQFQSAGEISLVNHAVLGAATFNIVPIDPSTLTLRTLSPTLVAQYNPGFLTSGTFVSVPIDLSTFSAGILSPTLVAEYGPVFLSGATLTLSAATTTFGAPTAIAIGHGSLVPANNAAQAVAVQDSTSGAASPILQMASVPEPSALGLLAPGLTLLVRRRRKK